VKVCADAATERPNPNSARIVPYKLIFLIGNPFRLLAGDAFNGWMISVILIMENSFPPRIANGL